MTLRIGDSAVDDDERSSSQMMFPVYFYLAHLVRPESLMPQFDSDDSDFDNIVEEQEEEEKKEEKDKEKKEENVSARVQDAHDADGEKNTSVPEGPAAAPAPAAAAPSAAAADSANGGDDDVLESFMADGSFTGTVTAMHCNTLYKQTVTHAPTCMNVRA